MMITAAMFEANLKCQTKCWMLATGEPSGAGNAYEKWVKLKSQAYRVSETELLFAASQNGEIVRELSIQTIKVAKWRFASCLAVHIKTDSVDLESDLHAVERLPAKGRGKPAQFIPIRFVFTNKLSKDDKTLLAYDAFTLSKSLECEISSGKIVFGENHTTLKLNTLDTVSVRKSIEKIGVMVSRSDPPDLVLNRHCIECGYQNRCRQQASDIDELSLLTNLTSKERLQFRAKGIFTVTQLSYLFHPRRRSKRTRITREKYHHSLKALAIHQGKIHTIGSPQLSLVGTPVYIDVEGIPDRDFYYLIGIRIVIGDSFLEHSFWADEQNCEEKLWRDFLAILDEVVNPLLIHYGSYEAIFFKRMIERFGEPPDGSVASKALKSALNVVTFLFAQVYFPTYSNGLKEIAGWLGFKWTDNNATGTQSIVWRSDWEKSKAPSVKQALVNYNLDDCRALHVVTTALRYICNSDQSVPLDREITFDVASADSLARGGRWRQFSSPIVDFEVINKAAQWDYQRERIYIRTKAHSKSTPMPKKMRVVPANSFNKEIDCEDTRVCPRCGNAPDKTFEKRRRILYDIRFSKSSIKRWVVRFRFRLYWCASCDYRFGLPKEFWLNSHFGRNLVALVIYEAIELNIPLAKTSKQISRLFGLELNRSMLLEFKAGAAKHYANTRDQILDKIVKGNLIHADETHIRLRNAQGYIWVFATPHAVVYYFAETREGDALHDRLKGFSGVLVSDFYKAYDSFPGPQQKCLIHLMRDLNEAVLDAPYDIELRQIVTGFGELLKGVVGTIDRWGLKTRFLRKHLVDVDIFYRNLTTPVYKSEAAIRWKRRFEKNKASLFTFLLHNNVPWNNNNAEHAIKAFAELRNTIAGLSTLESIDDYLILLSIRQTCTYSGFDFLDFLCSGQTTIDTISKPINRRNVIEDQ